MRLLSGFVMRHRLAVVLFWLVFTRPGPPRAIGPPAALPISAGTGRREQSR
jgi:hypothetical protein